MLNGLFAQTRRLPGYALLASVIIHALLLLLLLQTRVSVTPLTKSTPAKKAIKSFLYYRPKPKAPPVIASEPQPDTSVPQTAKAEPTTSEHKQALPKTPTSLPQPETNKPTEQPAPAKESVASKASSKKPSFSRYGSLKTLRDKINEQALQDEINQHARRKSPSVMDGEPDAVPHSEPQLSYSERREKNTTRYSDDVSISKGEDGHCSVTTDLGNIGMPGLKATQYFNCGESKAHKRYRQHMDKVLKKLGKK